MDANTHSISNLYALQGDTLALTKRLESILFSSGRKILRYMAGVTWRDRVRSWKVGGHVG